MIQLIQLQQASMKGASLLQTVSLRLTACCWRNNKGSCQRNNKGSCWRCRCAKAGNICSNCLPVQHGHCMNNEGIRNKSVISNTTTINCKFTNFSQMYWQIQHRHIPIKLLIQPLVMPSPFLTSMFPTVSLYLIAVGVTTRVAADSADV